MRYNYTLLCVVCSSLITFGSYYMFWAALLSSFVALVAELAVVALDIFKPLFLGLGLFHG